VSEWLTPDEVAARFGIKPNAIATARRAGQLRFSKVGRRSLIELVEVEDWLRRTKEERRGVSDQQQHA
jgi:excisionase family DNA binding protein